MDIELGRGNDTAALNEVNLVTILGGLGADTVERVNPSDGIDGDPISASFFGGRGRDVLTYRTYLTPGGGGLTPGVTINTRRIRQSALGRSLSTPSRPS